MLAGFGGEVEQVSPERRPGGFVGEGRARACRRGQVRPRFVTRQVVRRRSPRLYRASRAQTNRRREAPTQQSLGRAGQQKVDTANRPWPKPTVRYEQCDRTWSRMNHE